MLQHGTCAIGMTKIHMRHKLVNNYLITSLICPVSLRLCFDDSCLACVVREWVDFIALLYDVIYIHFIF